MNFLFVHQNFPGQFRHVAAALAGTQGHRVVAIGDADNLKGRSMPHPAIGVLAYPALPGANPSTHHYIRDYERAIRRGQSVARIAMEVRQKGFLPDVIVAHPGWGEGMFLKDIFPEARHIHYFEFFYRGRGSDVGFDPEYPSQLDDLLRVRIKNSTQLISLDACDAGISPTEWQRSQYPPAFQERIRVMHDGIDTDVVAPDPRARLELDGLSLAAGDEVLTYVARNLEPYRGFHVFMRALPRILSARPGLRVVIVGGDEVSYGKRLPEGQNYREKLIAEAGHGVDWSRVHWLGRVPYATFLKVLQVSRVHVYLTYPFVLSWSMLESMAAGCALVASDTQPVREVLRDGENGCLVDFFDHVALAERVEAMLADPGAYLDMRRRARETVVQGYDLKRICLPRWLGHLLNAKEHDV